MAWEKRGNNKYYYRKRRIGKRVVSEYRGYGLLAELEAKQDTFSRADRRAELRNEKKQRELIMALERELDQSGDQAILLARAVLLLAGYHPHKGQWRKQRE